MFATKITLFNYLQEQDDYIITLINNVEFQPKYETIPNITETEDKTKSLIIIPYYKDDTGIYVNKDNNKKYYLKPKQWLKASDKQYFTFQTDIDFIIVGDYSYLEDVNLNELKNSYDDLFMINRVKDFTDELKHFELIVN